MNDGYLLADESGRANGTPSFAKDMNQSLAFGTLVVL